MFFPLGDEQHVHAKNPLYALRDEILAKGGDVVDLISGNVNEHGIVYPQEKLKRILLGAAEQARVYHPDPLGQKAAREAIARWYGPLGLAPGRILLTPGTSVSYWYCFKLLAEPGSEVLCPRPCYPLFDYIARLCGLRLTHYQLDESRNWAINLAHLEQQITPRTRAIVLISPHNPTGMVADEEQLEALARIAARRELPIIADEVFSEFLFGGGPLPRPAATRAPLVFTLNGFSKMFALPGIKIGWIAVSGDERLAKRAATELEMVSDTFLPVNEIAQFAVPGIFEQGQAFLVQYRAWVAGCRNVAVEKLAGLRFAGPRGGFYLTAGIDRDEDQAALEALRHEHLLTHPGWFYEIEPHHLVITFVNDPGRLADALARLRRVL
jgi:aspartate/methionine/tyrosine aminotransferase